MKEVLSIPNASRTFEALRSLGYDLFSSIADLVDNSITEQVGSKRVNIHFDFQEDSHLNFRIADNGCGLSRSELEEAMRLGTETTYVERDLGKFGMGMKTASLSHCNVLTVLSKKQNHPICGFRWDMNRIDSSQNWILLQLDNDEINELLDQNNLIVKNSGTIVMWDDLFNLDQDVQSYSSQKLAQNYYFRLLIKIKLHLGMIYHRFLDGSLGEKNVEIMLNDEFIEPWDPFCRSEENTKEIELKKSLTEFKINGYDLPIVIRGYVLPNKDGFSSEDAWKKAKGLLSWNDSQGYYIYRANRIIRFGGWHNTKFKDEHDKLARISIDINPSLDKLFRITVNKAKIQFPEVLFQHLKYNLNTKIVNRAKAVYNKKDLKLDIRNNFRKNGEKVNNIAENLVSDNKISTRTASSSSEIEVNNPTGVWRSNKIHDFLKYGTNDDYEIISDHLGNENLWKIVCDEKDKFKVIVNADHPFYSRVYHSSQSKGITSALDALIFSLAFAELYNTNDQNAQLFRIFKSVFSKTLEKLTKEELI